MGELFDPTWHNRVINKPSTLTWYTDRGYEPPPVKKSCLDDSAATLASANSANLSNQNRFWAAGNDTQNMPKEGHRDLNVLWKTRELFCFGRRLLCSVRPLEALLGMSIFCNHLVLLMLVPTDLHRATRGSRTNNISNNRERIKNSVQHAHSWPSIKINKWDHDHVKKEAGCL